MDKPVKKFLEFNGKAIYFLSSDAQYWVALKPICDALEVNYNRQFQNLKKDYFLSQLFAKKQMVGADGRLREMIALPEKYVYGWIFKLQSSAPGFEDFQMKCYDLLYDYFHGVLAKRISTLSAKSADREELMKLQKEVAGSPEWQRIEELKKRLNGHGRDLRELDVALSESQMSIFN